MLLFVYESCRNRIIFVFSELKSVINESHFQQNPQNASLFLSSGDGSADDDNDDSVVFCYLIRLNESRRISDEKRDDNISIPFHSNRIICVFFVVKCQNIK